MARIGIALLATSLAFARGGATLQESELAVLQVSFRNLAIRLHKLRNLFAGHPAVRVAPAEPARTLADINGTSVHFARLDEELRAIDGWLDELEALLDGYSAASFDPNRLRAKRG